VERIVKITLFAKIVNTVLIIYLPLHCDSSLIFVNATKQKSLYRVYKRRYGIIRKIFWCKDTFIFVCFFAATFSRKKQKQAINFACFVKIENTFINLFINLLKI